MRRKYKLLGWVLVSFVAVCLVLISGHKYQAIAEVKLQATGFHPLPSSLEQWQTTEEDDYFDLIDSTPAGYLVWWRFPLKVYLEPVTAEVSSTSAEHTRQQQWQANVQTALAEWNQYLPLEEVNQKESADIIILRSQTAREFKLNPDTGLYDIPRAITAQTTYEFYLTEPEKVLAHKMQINISPDLSANATLAAARHELGHALGIWGHSDRETDALYFSQVRDTPQISPRDINTLKKIYQQPTKLGWQLN